MNKLEKIDPNAFTFKYVMKQTKINMPIGAIVKFPVSFLGGFKATVGRVIAKNDRFMSVRSLVGGYVETFLWQDIVKYQSYFKPLDHDEVLSVLEDNYLDRFLSGELKDVI